MQSFTFMTYAIYIYPKYALFKLQVYEIEIYIQDNGYQWNNQNEKNLQYDEITGGGGGGWRNLGISTIHKEIRIGSTTVVERFNLWKNLIPNIHG